MRMKATHGLLTAAVLVLPISHALAEDVPQTPILATAGECLYPVPGDPEEFLPLGPLALSFVPKIVGAGVDLLSAALTKAGSDQPYNQTVNVPLEYRPRCIQIARIEPDILRSSSLAQLKDRASFLIEFYLRPSEDGSALAVMPTALRYSNNLEKGGVGGRPRDLFATLTFSQIGSERSQTVTVQLGKRVAGPGQREVLLLPIDAPGKTDSRYPTGFAASTWIAMPFVSDASRCRQAATRPPHTAAAPPIPSVGTNGDDVPASGGSVGGQGGFDGGAPAPVPGRGALPVGPAGPVAGCSITAPGGWAGKPIKPSSIVVVITETRPGSKFAATLAKIMTESRSKIVDTLDPAKIKEGNAAERLDRDTNLKALATANADVTGKLVAFCALKGSTDKAAIGTAAANLYGAQIDITSKADVLNVPVPAVASTLVNYEVASFDVCPS